MVSGCMILWGANTVFQVGVVQYVGHIASGNLISVPAVGLRWTGGIMVNDNDFLTISECANYMGYTRPNVYRYLRKPDFPKVRIGHRWLIPKQALFDWMRDNGMRGVEDADSVR